MNRKTDDENTSRLPIDRLPSAARLPSSDSVKTRLSDDEVKNKIREFSSRFNELFRGLSQAEIARRLQTTDAVVKNYIEGNRFPTAELLLQIEAATNVNLHWLLTGMGSRLVETEQFYTDEEIERINRLAQMHGRTFQEEARALAMGAVELIENI